MSSEMREHVSPSIWAPQYVRRLQGLLEAAGVILAPAHHMRGRLPKVWRALTERRPAEAIRYIHQRQIPGIRRLGSKQSFRYVTASGRRITDPAELRRIRALAIPPAWTDVWICPDPDGHLQATGRDARGRKQYRYHPTWRRMRDREKYERILHFAEVLPQIRRRTARDLKRPGLPREKVLATLVRLLEKTSMRVGNDEYTRDNGSFGLTTLRDGHAQIDGSKVRFAFRGKGGIRFMTELRDDRLARAVKSCRDLPGEELFQYIDDQGTPQSVDSSDVNEYLRDIAGRNVTAKDFRTWAGTMLAAKALATDPAGGSVTQTKRKLLAAVDRVAKHLGNTKTVCRQSYIHPAVLDAYMEGSAIDPRDSAIVAMCRRKAHEQAG
jgi:DNA topoisomerase I